MFKIDYYLFFNNSLSLDHNLGALGVFPMRAKVLSHNFSTVLSNNGTRYSLYTSQCKWSRDQAVTYLGLTRRFFSPFLRWDVSPLQGFPLEFDNNFRNNSVTRGTEVSRTRTQRVTNYNLNGLSLTLFGFFC